MSSDLFASADRRRRQLGYNTFSAYVQYLVSEDLRTRGVHVRVEQPLDDDPESAAIKSAADEIVDTHTRAVAKEERRARKPKS